MAPTQPAAPPDAFAVAAQAAMGGPEVPAFQEPAFVQQPAEAEIGAGMDAYMLQQAPKPPERSRWLAVIWFLFGSSATLATVIIVMMFTRGGEAQVGAQPAASIAPQPTAAEVAAEVPSAAAEAASAEVPAPETTIAAEPSAEPPPEVTAEAAATA